VKDPCDIYFFDNTDPDGMENVLSYIPDLSRTIVLVISKSGGTKETRNGQFIAKGAFTAAGLDPEAPPKSLADLAKDGAEPKILLEDPRTSTPGLGLMLWLKSVYGDKAGEAWKGMAPKILTVSKSWDEAYGLFTKGEAPLVLSYTTSEAYHVMAEKTDRYKALVFPEGNYMQIEVAGMLKSAKHPELAKQFLQFLVSKDFQTVIPTTNWMLPVTDGATPPEFATAAPQPQKALLLPADEVAKHRAAWIKEWLEAVGQ
jgi:thiamine transport system substrate-binding protein